MPRCRRVLRLLIVSALASLLQACDVDLYTNLGEREANAMLAVLLRDGIPASRKVQDNGQLKVMVDEKRFAQAMAVLDDAGLPGQSFSNMGEVFKGNGLVSSPVQERAQMVYALSEELSHTVSQIDGILSARVHVVLPDNDLLKRGDLAVVGFGAGAFRSENRHQCVDSADQDPGRQWHFRTGLRRGFRDCDQGGAASQRLCRSATR